MKHIYTKKMSVGKEKINVLSLFDGMSCGQIALNKVGIEYENYFASEIDKYAIQVTQKNYPNTKQLGNVTEVKGIDLPKIDLLFGGSPCQSFSNAGNGKGFDGKSGLFWEYVRILKEVKPTYFLLENVVMKKEWEDVITEALGVKPIRINSKLLSAQNRPRLYWTNIPNVKEPNDKGIKMVDVLEDNADLKYAISEAKIKRVLETQWGKGIFYNKTHEKCGTLISGYSKQPTDGIYVDLGFKRRLTPTECEKIQTVPINYTDCVSDSQRYKMLGNGWTVDVIAHIFSFLKREGIFNNFSNENVN
jgi:DNA-cytosine methyltransferase